MHKKKDVDENYERKKNKEMSIVTFIKTFGEKISVVRGGKLVENSFKMAQIFDSVC